MTALGLIGIMVGGIVLAALGDKANEDEARAKWEAMSPQEQDNERRFWDSVMY